MLKYLLLSIFIFSLQSCKQTSNKSNNKNNDTTFTTRTDSISEHKGLLEFGRNDLSGKTLLPQSISDFITIGHEPYDSAEGDINGDNIRDILLVTSIINEDSVDVNSIINGKRLRFDSLPLKRQLLIFIGQKDGIYKLKCRNLDAIPCLDCCGMTDPYGGIGIINGQIAITEYCASNCKGISQYRFKYLSSQKNWYLDKIIEESYCFDYQDYSLDTITTKDVGKLTIGKFNINRHE